MKRITFLILILNLLLINNSYADWYIFDRDTNRAISKSSYAPSIEDMNTRNEFAFQSDIVIKLEEAEFFNNRLRVRQKSQQEKNKEKELSDQQNEMAIVYHQMFEDAYKKSYRKGKRFRKLDSNVDNIGQLRSKLNKKKSDFESAKTKLMALGLTESEIDSLR